MSSKGNCRRNDASVLWPGASLIRTFPRKFSEYFFNEDVFSLFKKKKRTLPFWISFRNFPSIGWGGGVRGQFDFFRIAAIQLPTRPPPPSGVQNRTRLKAYRITNVEQGTSFLLKGERLTLSCYFVMLHLAEIDVSKNVKAYHERMRQL